MAGKGFGTQKAQTIDAGWKLEVKFKDGNSAKLVFLHELDECLEVYTHIKPVQLNGQWRNIPSGNRNGHLFPAVPDAFDMHPDKDVAKVGLKRFAKVYVLDATGKSAELKGKVAFIELKAEIFKAIEAWVSATGKPLTGREVSVVRKGSGQLDTKYPTAVLDAHPEINPAELDDTEVQDYLYKLYIAPLTMDDLRNWYDQCMPTPQTAPLQAQAADEDVAF
jgi:hypothetical protein